MSLNKQQVDLIVSLLPVAVSLAQGLAAAVERLRADGYEVQDLDAYRKATEALRSLKDLAGGDGS